MKLVAHSEVLGPLKLNDFFLMQRLAARMIRVDLAATLEAHNRHIASA